MHAPAKPPVMVQAHMERHLFTRSEYHRLGACGFFANGERVELIDGEIIQMSPIGPTHASIVDRLNETFIELFGKRVIVRVQNPVLLNEYGEPNPDLMLLRRAPDFYSRVGPNPRDVLLMVEVSDTSLDKDRDIKGPLYARTGVKEYWIVNIPERCVEVYRRPSPTGYRSSKVFQRGDVLTFKAFPQTELPVKSIFGA